MAYNANSLVTLGLLKTVTARVKDEYTEAINEATQAASEEDVNEMLTEVFGSGDPVSK